MILPAVVRATLDEEPALDRVPLGDDELLVTPSRLLRYRAEGLLSDESVTEFPYDAERIGVSEGRRTATISLEYVDGGRTLSVPTGRFEDVLHPLLGGVLSAAGVLEAEEETIETFRFDELTVVVTDGRLVEYVGTAVWDGEYEEVTFEDVTDLEVERGRVATSVILTANGRRKRIKIRKERACPFEERLRVAIRAYHGIESLAELADGKADVDDDRSDEHPIESVDPLTIDSLGDDEHGVAGPKPEGTAVPGSKRDSAIEDELETLASAIERQEALLAEQRRIVDRLREELDITRGRDR